MSILIKIGKMINFISNKMVRNIRINLMLLLRNPRTGTKINIGHHNLLIFIQTLQYCLFKIQLDNKR